MTTKWLFCNKSNETAKYFVLNYNESFCPKNILVPLVSLFLTCTRIKQFGRHAVWEKSDNEVSDNKMFELRSTLVHYHTSKLFVPKKIQPYRNGVRCKNQPIIIIIFVAIEKSNFCLFLLWVFFTRWLILVDINLSSEYEGSWSCLALLFCKEIPVITGCCK